VTLVTHHPVIPVEENATFSTPITYRSVTSVTGRDKMLRVGDIVRLKAGGPIGRIVRTSPGGKFRVAWKMLYYSNHSAKKLMLAGTQSAISHTSLMEAEPQKVEASCELESA